MKRRRYLALLGTAGTLGTAGCAGHLSGGPGETPTLTPVPVGTDEPTATSTPGPPDTAESTDASTADLAESPPEAPPCDAPDYGDDVARVVCTGAAGPNAAMVLEPSATELELAGVLEFALRNGTERPFTTNFYGWRLDKQVEGRWYRVAPVATPQPAMVMQPGDSHTWAVAMDGDAHNGGEPVPRSEGTSEVTVPALGPGRYAFGIDGWFRGEAHERQTAFVARFDLHGAPLALTTTRSVESVTVEGDVLAARWTRNDDRERDRDYREATYVVERLRVTGTPDARRVTTEQVVRHHLLGGPLRDALTLATGHDVREVRLAGKTAAYPPFGVHGRTIEYDGTAYRISATAEAE